MSVVLKTRYEQRLLKPLKSTYIPAIWLFLDTETKPRKKGGITTHYFDIAWSCLWFRPKEKGPGSEDWVFHSDEKDFCDYIENVITSKGNITIVGHNVFFDLQASGFYKYFTQANWQLQFYYDKGLTYILKISKNGATATVVSSTNWFDFSLARLGKTLGLPKLDVDFKKSTPSELKTYCKRDVEILVLALKTYLDFLVTHDLGKFSLTKASQAFTAYRTRFMGRKIFIHDNADVQALERAAYMGGRVEAFFIGKARGKEFVSMDINSMYPYVMISEKYPYRLIGYYENPDKEFIRDALNTYAVIAEIEVKTTLAIFAVKHKGKTVFPIGRFSCYVTTKGLIRAFEIGCLIKVKKAAIYRTANLFNSYVNYFHGLRIKYKNESNDIFELLTKYMLNSLYGKFAQLKIITDIEDENTGRGYFREEVYSIPAARTFVMTHLMNKKIIQYPEGEGELSNVAIAAHITENARFYLWDIMQRVGMDNVLYCDTDSVKIRASQLHKLKGLLDDSRLGYLKCEDRSKSLIIGGAKNYRTEQTRKIKGIPRNAKEVRPGVFVFESFLRQTTHLRGGFSRGVQTKQITRALKSPYSKGIVQASGKVTPLIFPLPY